MKKTPAWIVVGIAALGVFLWWALRSCRPRAVVEDIETASALQTISARASRPVVQPPFPVPAAKPVKPRPPVPPTAAPPVKIHKELIPKNIEIVRVYYANMITGPDSFILFDINGTGFTEEFHKMITVDSGHPEVSVQDLTLMTPNQIRGSLIVNKNAPTAVSFPKVLIRGKVVFQAPDPFAVIRPGEVLNLVFTEMAESGRAGRFRVFTNLTPEMLERFKVAASTDAIQVSDLRPFLPFVVDGAILIGPAAGGDYGMRVTLGDKVLWNRDGIVKVVKPNIGQTGLLQKVVALDGFFRPGDWAVFAIQGSGFQPQDAGLLSVRIPSWAQVKSSFTYTAPGRLELALMIPENAEVKTHGLAIYQGEEKLFDSPDTFQVVGPNWTREVQMESELTPGGTAMLVLKGRDLSREFISNLKTEVDEPELKIGTFEWRSSSEAVALISAGPLVKPGDYLVKLAVFSKTVVPRFGSIIQVKLPKQ